MVKNATADSVNPARILNQLTRIHFLYIAAYIISIVVFDSWNLITHEAVINFWTAAAIFLTINTLLWYLSRRQLTNKSIYRAGVLLLLAVDIIFAALVVYWERGLASSSVILFAIPIVSAAAMRSRSTLLATTALSAGAFSVANVRYFYEYYGESFRVELYGEIAFYSAILFVLAGLLLAITHPSRKS